MSRAIHQLVIHHTASPNTWTVKEIDASHRQRGFREIGYHAVVLVDGKLQRGRAENQMGAHAKGANQGTLGVSLVGNFEKEEPTMPQLKRLVRVLAYWCSKYNVDPQHIVGHRDVGTTATLCPGANLYKHIKGIQGEVKNLLATQLILGWPASQ